MHRRPDPLYVGDVSGLRRALVAVLVAVAVFVPAPATQALSGPPTPANLRHELIGDARQVVVVSTPRWNTTVASVSMYQLIGTTWRRVAGPYGARIGRRGLSLSHREGDGTTPAGSFAITSGFGLAAKAGTKLAYTQIRPGSCWISQTGRLEYNTMVSSPTCGLPNEDLYRIARAGPYRRTIVTDYNVGPTTPGFGSAIFLHTHAYRLGGGTRYTSGCVSLSSFGLVALWRRLDPALGPRVIIGPTKWLLR